MPDGHAVVIDELRKYSGKLNGDMAIPREIAGLVGQSDVGDKSWGVVGIFVKGKYTEMLTELNDLLREMSAGLEAASEKMNGAANAYQAHEDDSVAALQEILRLLETPAKSRTPKIGPAK
ncbi:hypothetical protein [Amycolatopsis sp. NPDC059657]|uniref:hypothetical protein n=1 Tax=Amycolatopsis sp. NPDC059657 TaxID=3346899 RepID=UPI00367149D3